MSALRVVVELDEGDPVVGRVGLDGERGEAFEGLLEMLAAFDRLRRSASRADEDSGEAPD